MAKMAVKGIDEYALKLSKLGAKSSETAGKAIYAGAEVVADAIKQNIDGLETVDDKYNLIAYGKGKKSKLSKKQKEGLKKSFGITKMQKDSDGFYNVKLGFDGYNDIKTKKYPDGQPNQLIARIAESGSTFMDKTPFVRPALSKTKKQAQEVMQKVIDVETEKIMKQAQPLRKESVSKAIKGLSIPVFGKYNYNATTKAVTYTNGIIGGHAIEYTISIESTENNPLNGDNRVIENDVGKFSTGTLSLGTDDLTAAVSKFLLGLKEASVTVEGVTGVTETIYDDDAIAPELGFGIIEMHQKDGVDKYKAVILCRVTMSLPEDTATTKGQSIEWQTKTIEGTLQRSEEVSTNYNHPWRREAWFTTEADALAYLKTILGVVEATGGV